MYKTVRTTSMISNNSKGEIGVKTHTRGKGNGQVCEKSHAEAWKG
jgi:hypothetical protein